MRLDRREFTTLAATGILGTLAGCGGGDGSGIDESALDGPTATVAANVPPAGIQLNPYALQRRGTAVRDVLDQLVLPVASPTGRTYTSGHTWTIDGDEVAVPCAVESYDVQPPDGYTLQFDDRLTYWSGDPLDARAFHAADRLGYLMNFSFDDDVDFGGELVSNTEYRWTFNEERNRTAIEAAVFPGTPPLPPAFSDPWIEQLEDAGSEAEVDSIFAEVSDVEVTLATLVEEGYGTGAYAIESTDDLYNDEFLASRREDHPAEAALDHLIVRYAGGQKWQAAVNQGRIDVGEGVIAREGGDLGRESVPDSHRQLGTHRSPRSGGMQVLFNWSNEHVRRLWVRRALVAAAPLSRTIENAFGATMVPPRHATGMLSRVDEAALPADLLEALFAYPIDRDRETARSWLERADYQEQDGAWYDPDGSPVSLRILIRSGSSTQNLLGTTIADGLRSFGFQTEVSSVRPRNYEAAFETGDYAFALGWAPSGLSPGDFVAADTGAGRFGAAGPPLAVVGNPLETCEDESGWWTTPAAVTLPSEPGALAIDGASYDDGGATYRHDGGTDVSVCGAVDSFRAPESDPDELAAALETCVRWYNYAVPSFVFAQKLNGGFGNTDEFAFPERDSQATRVTRYWTENPAHYLVQSGTIR